MADNDMTGGNGIDAGMMDADAASAPQLGLVAQYVKDLSFENPNAPAVYQQQEQPRIDVGFNIGTASVGPDMHEVTMKIEVKAAAGIGTVFQVELVYAGLFAARNIPDEAMRPFLYAEAPRLLFPFARRIIAETVRDGNFPPLMLDPIDFGAMYEAQAQQEGLAGLEPAGQA